MYEMKNGQKPAHNDLTSLKAFLMISSLSLPKSLNVLDTNTLISRFLPRSLRFFNMALRWALSTETWV